MTNELSQAEIDVIESFRARATKLFGPVTEEGDVGALLRQLKATLEPEQSVHMHWSPEWDHWAVRIENYYGEWVKEGEGRTQTQALQALLATSTGGQP